MTRNFFERRCEVSREHLLMLFKEQIQKLPPLKKTDANAFSEFVEGMSREPLECPIVKRANVILFTHPEKRDKGSDLCIWLGERAYSEHRYIAGDLLASFPTILDTKRHYSSCEAFFSEKEVFLYYYHDNGDTYIEEQMHLDTNGVVLNMCREYGVGSIFMRAESKDDSINASDIVLKVQEDGSMKRTLFDVPRELFENREIQRRLNAFIINMAHRYGLEKNIGVFRSFRLHVLAVVRKSYVLGKETLPDETAEVLAKWYSQFVHDK